ncbi:methyltransferase C-terminal domain-containing protein [Bradyrhizobium sp. PMVTL-01]|uniref:methyltransferase C-terminal domain-containing protein n=1 Tax=Bradyrhizobium sp. PMVTL-01 TaxID=3434999 RepID=UPI003F6E4F1D
MELIDVQHIGTKGGSIRVTVQRAGGAKKPSAEVARFVAEEERLGVDQPAYYAPYVKKIAAIHDELVAMADAAHARGQLVAGYGVSVATTTLLPQFGLENKIDFLVDDDPKKANVMAGPGYDIPILPPAALYERKPAFVVVFAWRLCRLDPGQACPLFRRGRQVRGAAAGHYHGGAGRLTRPAGLKGSPGMTPCRRWISS